MSDYETGAHDAIDAIINMFKNIQRTPIIGSARYMTKVAVRNGEPFISIDNVIQLLDHHRDGISEQLLEKKHDV